MKLIHGVKVMTVYTKLGYVAAGEKPWARRYGGLRQVARLDGGRDAVM